MRSISRSAAAPSMSAPCRRLPDQGSQSWAASHKELGNLIQMRVFQSLDSLAQLLQSERGVRCAVRMVNNMHQLPDHSTEAVHKPLILAFQFCKSLLVLHRQIAGLLEAAPTQLP